MTEDIFTYLVITEDGASHEHRHRMAATDTMEGLLRKAVGGWLEHVRVSDPGVALWCDEDGGPAAGPPTQPDPCWCYCSAAVPPCTWARSSSPACAADTR